MVAKTDSGKQLYEIALEKATEWNHGRTPGLSVVEGFLFNVLNYPEQFGLKVTVTVERIEPVKPGKQDPTAVVPG